MFCLARALLRNSSIMIMDEATSNIDRSTDQQLQAVLKAHFGNKTVITIAHRLMTVAEYDWILVMAEGRAI